jgi:hypothetical protein
MVKEGTFYLKSELNCPTEANGIWAIRMKSLLNLHNLWNFDRNLPENSCKSFDIIILNIAECFLKEIIKNGLPKTSTDLWKICVK